MNEMNDAQRKLAEDNLNLVYHTIHRYFPALIGDSDIVSTGYMGLCRATLRWDESKSKFTSYAVIAIRNAIIRELQNRKKQINCVSLNAPINDCLDDGGDLITGEDVVIGDELDIFNLLSEDFLKNLNEDERVVYLMRAKGCKKREILQTTGYNRGRYNKVVNSIKRKYLKAK